MKTTDNTFSLPMSNSIEENAKLWAKHYDEIIKPGQGVFIDLKAVPELEKPVFDYFLNVLGWSLEYEGTFVRKPENL